MGQVTARVHVYSVTLFVFLVLRIAGSQRVPPELYECPDGREIPSDWLCDGNNDCSDNSDEENCRLSCPSNKFQCHSRQCINEDFVCDGDIDCNDGSDEQDCVQHECYSTDLRCNNGRCVSQYFLCDGDDDCGDGSDELPESCEESLPCGDLEHKFECDSGTCISLLWQCDGEPDCDDEGMPSDEADCGEIVYECQFGMFNCTNGGCINANLLCDGESDCPHGNSDEEDCPSQTVCQSHQFTCPDKCIPMEWSCDGEDDCGDWSDEFGCEGVCTNDQYSCITGGCVNLTQRCDGTENCPDGSDEFLCTPPPPPVQCAPDQFPCLDGRQCIPSNLLCNNRTHCTDQSDEDPLQCASAAYNVSECAVGNGGCHHICNDTLYAHFCTCRHGYMLDPHDRRSCRDIDECSMPGTCSQLCNNTEGSYVCGCVEGYVESATHGGCKAIGPPPFLLFVNRVDIRRVNVDGSQPQLLIKHLHNSIALDFHYILGYMFWTDLSQDSIKRANLDGTNITTVIDTELEGPDGLAVDWVNDKLYWSDAEKVRIEVSDLDGKRRTVLFSTGLDRPRAILLDPHTRLMFWTDWGSYPKIERASMDGKGRVVLHDRQLFWPNALTMDFPTQTLYWGDARLHVIESSDINGRNRRAILTQEQGVRHPFALTVFEDKVYWTDWEAKAVMRTQKGVGVNATEVYGNLFHPMDVHVIHPARQPPVPNPCAENDGGCSFMCLPSAEEEEGYGCICPTGIRVDENMRDCKPLDTFLLFAHRTDIRRISLDVEELVDVILPLTNLSSALALDWDNETNSLYWTDISRNTISVATIEGENQQVLISDNIHSPAGLAIDWVSRKLYWTDSSTDRIEVANLDGSYRSIVIFGNLDRPRDIVVHPAAGLMFWSDWGSRPKIERANLDGTQRRTIVSTNLTYPNGLALDYGANKIYWADAGVGVIEYANFDGSDRTLVLNTDLPHPFGLTLHEDFVYWTDWQYPSVQRADKINGTNRTTVVDNLERPNDIHVFHRNRQQPVINPCGANNGGCSHLCLTRPSRRRPLDVSCACPTGHKLKDDGKTCNPHINSYLIFPTLSDIRQASLDRLFQNYIADVVIPISTVGETYSVDVDIVMDEIYWTNEFDSIIYKASLQGGVAVPVINSSLETPKSVAVDWIARNLYWIDSGTRRLEVAKMDSSSRRVLFSNLISPSSIVVDLQSHTMFWTDLGDHSRGFSPKIERASMDGSRRRVIINHGLRMPRAITVDNPEGLGGKIYWTDSLEGTIDYANLDGSGRRSILAGLPSPYGVAVSGDFVFWTDWSDRTLNRAIKTDGSNQQEQLEELEGLAELRLIRKTDLANIDSFDHPCDRDQGCSDLCLPNQGVRKFTCACPTGITLRDNSYCPNFPDIYLLFAARSTIRRISMDTQEEYTDIILLSNLRNTLSVDYLLTGSQEGLMFWSDESVDRIFVANLDGTNETEIIDNLRVIDGIAVDWVSRNIYWTDTGTNRIEVATIDGAYRRVVIHEGLDEPRALALHPNIGLMFWTDWSSTNPKIERASMDGTDRTTLVSDNIIWPNGITIDYATDTVYWVDARTHTIESMNLNGNDRRILLSDRNIQHFINHPFGVAVHDGFVFWSDWQNRSIFRADIDEVGATNLQRIQGNINLPMTIQIVDTNHGRPGELTPAANPGPCAFGNGGCPYLCLPVDSNRRRCACPDQLGNCTETVGPPTVTPPSPIATTTPPTTTPALEVHSPSSPPPRNGTSPPTRHTSPTTGTTTTTTSSDSSETTDAVSSSEDEVNHAVLIPLVVVSILVLLVLIGVVVVAVYFLKRQREQQEREIQLQRLAINNPTTGLNKLKSPPPTGGTVILSKQSNIFPKTSSTSLKNNEQTKQPNDGVNVYIEEPEFFEIPQPTRKRRVSTPSSPPLKPPPQTCLPMDNEKPPPRPPKTSVSEDPRVTRISVPKESDVAVEDTKEAENKVDASSGTSITSSLELKEDNTHSPSGTDESTV